MLRRRRLWMFLILAAPASGSFFADPEEERWSSRWLGEFDAARCRGAEGENCLWLHKLGSVETRCRFDVRVGLCPRRRRLARRRRGRKKKPSTAPDDDNEEDNDEPCAGPAMKLRVVRNDREEEVLLGPDDVDDEMPNPVICEFEHEEATETMALLMVSNSFTYLFRQWPYLANKLGYAKVTGMRAFLWVGELGRPLARSVEGDCRGSKNLRDMLGRTNGNGDRGASSSKKHHQSYYRSFTRTTTKAGSRTSAYLGDARDVNSNHHVKITGAYALLDHPHIKGVVYVDLDTFVRGNGLRVPFSKWLVVQQDPTVDVYFRPHQGMHVDENEKLPDRWAFWANRGHTFFVRDSDQGTTFLSEWITHRCGFKDQYSLWHATLNLAHRAGCLDYRGELFQLTYREAMRFNFDVCLRDTTQTTKSNTTTYNATQLADLQRLCVPCGQRVARCPNFNFCADVDVTTLYHASIFAGKDLRVFHYDKHNSTADIAFVDQFAGEGLNNHQFLAGLGLEVYRPNDFGLKPKQAMTKLVFAKDD